MAKLVRMTAAQVIVDYLIHERVPYILGILGHGNLELAEAIQERGNEIRFIPVQNEQNAVHIATAYAKMTGRPLAVTTSVGPGATNLVTGAATAHVNRLPVLLLPGDTFTSGVGPVLQQVEGNTDGSLANECLRPVSVYWERITRADQLQTSLPKAFDRMMQPGNQGPAVLCLPMDVQAEKHNFDIEMLHLPRDTEWEQTVPDRRALLRAVSLIQKAKRPLLIAGGGVMMSKAWNEVVSLAERFNIPVVHTQAGNGTVLSEHPLNAFSVGPAGSDCGNILASKADLIIGVGTRYTDFTTSSETLFKRNAKFININISNVDIGKQRAVKLFGDAKATLRELIELLQETSTSSDYDRTEYIAEVGRHRKEWLEKVAQWVRIDRTPLPQSTLLDLLNRSCNNSDVVVAAAGSLPGDLLRLWRTKDPSRKGYHVEYGFSTMGYEIAAGIGVKLADPKRNVYVMVGDGSFLMASQEIVTAVQERIAITIILVDNQGHRSIKGCQENNGFTAFATGPFHEEVKFPLIAEGYGANVLVATGAFSLQIALERAKEEKHRPTVIYVRSEQGAYEEEGYSPPGGNYWNLPNSKRTGRKKKQTIR